MAFLRWRGRLGAPTAHKKPHHPVRFNPPVATAGLFTWLKCGGRFAKPAPSRHGTRPSLLRQTRRDTVSAPVQIAILDDDHVIRLTRYAISGPGEITTNWAHEFFLPEEMD